MKTDTFRWDSGDGEIAVEITVSSSTLQMGLDRDKLVNKAMKELRERKNRYSEWLEERVIKEDADPNAIEEEIESSGIGEDFSTWMAYTCYYPACVCGTTKIKNDKEAKVKISKNLSLDQFLNLPERFVLRWTKAVLAINPHWMLGYKEEDEQGEVNAPANENGLTSES